MLRLLYAVILGLIGAGIVHIAVLLLIPDISDRDVWSKLQSASDLYKTTRLDSAPGSPPIVKSIDPLFSAAACRFDLNDGVLRVTGQGHTPFWSVSVYNRAGENIYSFNDHTLARGGVDFSVATPTQMIEVRKEFPDGTGNSIYVETASDEGIVVVRSFVPDPSWKKSVSDFLDGISCMPE